MPESRLAWADELIGTLSPSWGRQPVTTRPDALPAEAPDLSTLDTLLDAGLLRTPYIQVFVDHSPVPAARYTRTRTVLGSRAPGFVDAARVRELMAGGATVMLPRLDHWHQPVITLARALSARTRRRVDAFGFYTPPGNQGLAIHRDDADVILLQTAGSKRWSIHAGPSDGQWDAGPVAEPGAPVLEIELSAGEILYIPRGFAHAGIGGDGVSAHLSFVVTQIGTAELRHALRQLVGEAAPQLAPRPLTEEALTVTAEELLAGLRKRLDDLGPRALIELADRVPHTNLRHELGLSEQ